MSRDSIEVIRMRGAKAALDKIFENSNKEQLKELRSAAESVPYLIRTLGLGSGVATLAAKEGKRLEVVAMIGRWLVLDCKHSPLLNATSERKDANDLDIIHQLLDKISSSSRNEYRLAQVEAMGFAGWIKRLCQAFCPRDNRS